MLTFAVAALLLIMIPGPDQALITRNALVGGRSAGLLTMTGGMLGLSVHVSAASLGISALLLASVTAFTVLKVIGTVYLVWMGIATLRSARKRVQDGDGSEGDRSLPRAQCLRQGFLSNALNPKVALFFVTFLPQFLPDTRHTLASALQLSAVFVLLYLLWFTLYTVTVDRFGAFLRRPAVRQRIERSTGALLIAFGIRLALQH
ncbi:threonine/homoserine/homoserine lactone efflux protein [Kitasatospora gansuensis]|uniref:Threonine/homoserine/homoserine lactone efflux protein n=1 Tax=Kitasatospora gansuensis TaxID=258050 RepID=A0A7W7SJA2_9ACTN|nr:LysE family translocator [Kitasatospora gansuensis]MBB4951485.1 threonine/homoserine/homoserine lactone efflux protein [Kitasatospora gansuensis]